MNQHAPMDLTKMGWNADLYQQFAPRHAKGLVPARMAEEDRHFFRVWTAEAELLAQVTSHRVHETRGSNSKLPKVGGLGHRKTRCQRAEGHDSGHPSAAHPTLPQDDRPRHHGAYLRHEYRQAFMVTAAGASFDAARLEHMLVMVHESGARRDGGGRLHHRTDACGRDHPQWPRGHCVAGAGVSARNRIGRALGYKDAVSGPVQYGRAW